jgi:hypothetical protein
MGTLTPQLSILPAAQRALWECLADTPTHFVLYGGTALALRLGHRQSVDFDFFSAQPFATQDLLHSVSYLVGQKVTQDAKNTLTCEVQTPSGVVKLRFFGDLDIFQISPPTQAVGNGIAVASLDDLFGMKCATLPQRNAVRDYLDIHALITQAKLPLARGIACARAIYGRQYVPTMTLQALSYFKDLPERLPDKVMNDLLKAVQSWVPERLPDIGATQKIGARPPSQHRQE